MKSMSMTERTDSVSTILKTPMTLIEFKERYNELLNYHLNEYIENNELSFIKKWFTIYSNGCNLLAKRIDPNLTLIEKRGLKALGTKQYYHNLELSFGLICKFLKQRKNELKTIPQQNEIVNPDEVRKNKPDSKIPYSIMDQAISSIRLALIEDKKTVPAPIKQEQTYVPKPCFKSESIDGIITDLKDFFDPTEHAELKRIIETGSNANDKLLFRDSGNRLTDYFKQLIENDIITGCSKKDLIDWVVLNFKYTQGSTQKEYIYKTVEKTISGGMQLCKNPININKYVKV